MKNICILLLMGLLTAAPLRADVPTSVDKTILTLEEASRKGDKAQIEKIEASITALATPEAYFKLGKFFMAKPTVNYLRVSDFSTAIVYFEKTLALAADSEMDEKWKNRARKQLADFYYLGEGVPRDQEKAVALLQQGIKSGNGEAAYRYGMMLERGLGATASDPQAAARWYRFALRDRYGPAAFALVTLYRRGIVPQPTPHSLKDMQALGLSLVRQKVEEGDPEAAYTLGRLYQQGEEVPADPAQALKWYEVAMKGGKGEAYRGAALLYGKGQGVPRDAKKATELMEKAALMGSLPAAMALGKTIQHDPSYYLEADDEKALTWLKRASAVGDSGAVKLIANYYLTKGDVAEALQYLEKSAESGNVGSMLNLYKLYTDGTQVKADPARASRYLEQARQSSNVSLSDRVKLGKLLMDPLDPHYDPKLGVEYLKGAAEAGHKPSIVQLAKFYSNKRSTYYDPSQAFIWHSKAAAEGALNSMLWVAEALTTGVGTKKDKEQARIYFFQALQRVKTGDAEVLSRIGQAYKLGYGTDRNIIEGLKWFEKAAKLGDPNAKIEFAKVVLWDTVPGYHPEDAIRMMREAAHQGESSAYLELGKIYANGMGDVVDYETAYYYFDMAAKANITEAYYYLGLLTLAGRGTEKNVELAKQYLVSAASGGFSPASLVLGVLYQEGAFGAVNEQEAVTYFSRAANAGEPEAHYYLGMAYLNGKGIGQNKGRALEELSKAADTGHMPAKTLYISLTGGVH